MVDHGQESLLQNVGNGTSSCGQERHGHELGEKAQVECHLESTGLTVEATPAGDVAGLVVWKDEVSSRETSSHDGVGEGDGRLQLDQGDVVAAEDTGVTLSLGLGGFSFETLGYLPNEEGVPALVHDDVSSAHKGSTVFCLYQVVLAHGHSVLPARAERRKSCDVTFRPYLRLRIWCVPASWAVVSYLIQ